MRSRTWEEWRDDQWTLTAADDLGRIARAQAYGRAVVNRLDDFDALTRLRLLAASTRRATIELVDPLAAAGFLLGVAGARDVRFDTVGVQPERTVAERRSPFAANDLGAMARYVLAAGEAARVRSSGCSGMGVTPG